MTRTLKFTDGFAIGDYASPIPKWTSGIFSGSGSGRFSNSSAWHVDGTSSNPIKSLGVDAQGWHFGFGFKKTLITTTGDIFRLQDGISVQVALGVMNTGQLIVYRNATELTRSDADKIVSQDVYAHIEMRIWVADGTSGRITVKVNGVTFIDFTGDTKNTVNAYANNIRLINETTIGECWFTDFYAYQSTDFVNDTWVGDVRIFSLLPNGAGNYSQWTPLTGSNYQMVDETISDGDTTYNYSSTAGQLDSYAFGDISGSGTVVASVLYALARKDDAGTRTVNLLYRRSSTDVISGSANLGDNYDLIKWIMETDPLTLSAWLFADINSSEFGIKLVS